MGFGQRASQGGSPRYLVEIQQAIEKLAPKERAKLRNWLEAQHTEDSPG
jgi:hypothetical protein